MLTVALGLVGAAVYGAADFLGGFAAKRINTALVTAVAAASGLVMLAGIAWPIFGGTWTARDTWLGIGTGVAGGIGLALLYACLSIGPMSILSPLSALVSAVCPAVWGVVVNGERFKTLGWIALTLALIAVVLVGFVPERGAVRPRLLGIVLAIGSGLGIGGFLILIDQTSDASGVTPLIANRLTNTTLTLLAFGAFVLLRLLRKAPDASPHSVALGAVGAPGQRGRGLMFAALGGFTDVVANVAVLGAVRLGDLTVASVLTALYPASTVVLAAIVLKERIAPVQWVGLVLALTAAGMLAAS
ncbi:MAG TPA: EamA family transporter [Candidatus Lumbricidophila sp.]|nr:EamA family transporter [Candidatus Lumbricidophila sp.]